MRNHPKALSFALFILLAFLGCESETGSVDLEASKAAAKKRLESEVGQAAQPKAPIRDTTKLPKAAPPRASQR